MKIIPFDFCIASNVSLARMKESGNNWFGCLLCIVLVCCSCCSGHFILLLMFVHIRSFLGVFMYTGSAVAVWFQCIINIVVWKFQIKGCDNLNAASAGVRMQNFRSALTWQPPRLSEYHHLHFHLILNFPLWMADAGGSAGPAKWVSISIKLADIFWLYLNREKIVNCIWMNTQNGVGLYTPSLSLGMLYSEIVG